MNWRQIGRSSRDARQSLRARSGGTTLSFSQPTGTIEVTSRTADSISGKFDVKDRWTQLSGEFHAPLK
ncbi:MAG: hypothetical protein KBB14_20165 [Thermoanaerobaculia bacterium]|nr:hypothetical protein [Thermoanaerobaculia bacterium]